MSILPISDVHNGIRVGQIVNDATNLHCPICGKASVVVGHDDDVELGPTHRCNACKSTFYLTIKDAPNHPDRVFYPEPVAAVCDSPVSDKSPGTAGCEG